MLYVLTISRKASNVKCGLKPFPADVSSEEDDYDNEAEHNTANDRDSDDEARHDAANDQDSDDEALDDAFSNGASDDFVSDEASGDEATNNNAAAAANLNDDDVMVVSAHSAPAVTAAAARIRNAAEVGDVSPTHEPPARRQRVDELARQAEPGSSRPFTASGDFSGEVPRADI
jgi:hypothetical protein